MGKVKTYSQSLYNKIRFSIGMMASKCCYGIFSKLSVVSVSYYF